MADEDEILDDEAVEGEEGEEGAPKSKKLLFIIIGVVLLCGGGAAFLLLKGGDDPKAGAKKEVMVVPPIYVNLDPPFVVNFEAEAAVRFLQVTVSVMTRDPHIQELLRNNDPRIRNDLLMLLSNQKYDTISTREGKEKLQTESLEAVRTVVKGAGGEPEKIEALYFTAFVMQ
jgi:flagellar FliL protein